MASGTGLNWTTVIQATIIRYVPKNGAFVALPLETGTIGGLLMETFKLVMPENLNHFGVLFGGYMLMWVDEIAWIAASLEFPEHRFVTIGMDRVEFRHGVRQGTILKFVTTRTRAGNTSVDYMVEVFRGVSPAHGELSPTTSEAIFSTTVTLVNVDENGQKKPL